MKETEAMREMRAAGAGEDEISTMVHDPSQRVIMALLANRNIGEEDVLIIATRKNLPGDVLEMIAKDKRWLEQYPIRLALARNPKTPLFSALSIVRYLRLFDQVELARNTALPVIFRKKIEAIVMEKIPTMALGMKKTLSRIAAGNVLLKLIQDGYPEVVIPCLNNPHLVEAHLFKIINREETNPATVRLIAEHPNWSNRYHIRFALVRNKHTPLSRSVVFVSGMKISDLKELFVDPSLPAGVRPCIHRELLERGEDVENIHGGREEIFVFGEEEADLLSEEMGRYGSDANAGEEGDE